MDNCEFDNHRIQRFKDRVHSIKAKLREKEKIEQRSQKKLGFVPSKDLIKISLFTRNPFEKMNIFKFNLAQHKMKMEMLNRNLQKNKIEYAVRKAALHYINPKSRLNITDRDLISDLKNKILINRQNKELSTGGGGGGGRASLRNIDNSNRTYHQRSPSPGITNNNQNQHHSISNTNRNRMNVPIKIIKSSIKSISETNSRANRAYSAMNINKGITKINSTNSIGNGVIKEKPREIKVINKPIYTTDINNFIQKYKRIKRQINTEKQKFENFSVIDQDKDKVAVLMGTRSEMKFHKLKQEFIQSNIKLNTSRTSIRKTKQKFREEIIKQIEDSDYT